MKGSYTMALVACLSYLRQLHPMTAIIRLLTSTHPQASGNYRVLG